MKEELQTALAEVITSALGSAEATKEFVIAEMPDVIQQILTWEMTQASIYAGIFLIISGLFAWGFVLVVKKQEDADAALFCMGGTIVAFAVFVMHLLTVIKIWIAPKVYLIEYAADLLKQ